MVVKVIIVRKMPADKVAEAKPLVAELRKGALHQAGYISGESLVNAEDPEENLVISTWETLEHWEAWRDHPQRQEVQAKLDALLGSETLYQVYYHG